MICLCLNTEIIFDFFGCALADHYTLIYVVVINTHVILGETKRHLSISQEQVKLLVSLWLHKMEIKALQLKLVLLSSDTSMELVH